MDFPNDSPARVHEPALKSLKIVEDLVPVDISKNERIQICLEACRIIKNHFGDEKFIRGNCDQAPFSTASMMRSSAEWMMDLMMEDELVFNLLDYCTDAASQFIRPMVDTGVDMVSNGDSPAGPDMISPEMYEIFALPDERIIVKEAHRLGKPYMLHICGNTDIILDKMIKTGTDALELDYKTNIDLVQEMCNKSKVTFSGNIDPSVELSLCYSVIAINMRPR